MKNFFIISCLLLFGHFANAQNISGTYQTDFNELTLIQNGKKVTGTYKHADGRIEGTLNGKILTGWWYQSNGKGRFVFEFNSNFSAYTGKWGYNEAVPSSQWNGKKTNANVPETFPDISGIFQTDFNELTIVQNGNVVSGTYKHADGRIEGILNGHTLTGWWYQSNGKGRFVFEFNGDFSAYTGKWGYNEAAPSSQWNGRKTGAQSQSANNHKPATNSSPQPTILPIAGNYQTDFNELTIFQNGNTITGTYKHADGRIEGTLNGRTLTGWWYQSNGKGRFVFEFNSDASAFQGKWGYNNDVPSAKWNGKR